MRLEFGPGADTSIKRCCGTASSLSAADVYDMAEEVDYTTLFELMGLPLPELRDVPWTPLSPPAFDDGADAIFAAIQAGDVLVHHPYESFDASVEHFIAAAADDPQTSLDQDDRLSGWRRYAFCEIADQRRRTRQAGRLRDGDQGPFRRGAQPALGRRAGKRRRARHLRRARAQDHGKTALVVRKEAGGLRCYAHIGTGNYHVKTARLYADFGLLTCNPLLTRDVVNLFHYLTGHAHAPDCTTLLVAPINDAAAESSN